MENETDANRVLNMYDEKNNYKIALLTNTVHECSLWLKKIESAKETHAKVISISHHGKRKTRKILQILALHSNFKYCTYLL